MILLRYWRTVCEKGVCLSTGAVSTRVSNALGAKNPAAAELAVHVSAFLTVVVSGIGCANTLLLRRQLALAFSSDPEVVATAGATMPILASALVGDGINAVCSGVVRGVGRQALGAVLNVCSFWGVGIPLSVLLAFHFKLGVAGLWIGLAVATSLQGEYLPLPGWPLLFAHFLLPPWTCTLVLLCFVQHCCP